MLALKRAGFSLADVHSDVIFPFMLARNRFLHWPTQLLCRWRACPCVNEVLLQSLVTMQRLVSRIWICGLMHCTTTCPRRLWDDPHTSIHSWVGTVGIVGEWVAVRWAELRSALYPDWSLN